MPVPAAVGVAVTRQIVVETTRASVVTNVVFARAGQSWTVEGHAVIVAVRVVKTVEVVLAGVSGVSSPVMVVVG
jgi:hypothetical protein